MKARTPRIDPSCAGFTASNLLVTLAIAGVLLAATIPAVSTTLRTYHRNGAAREVLAEIRRTQALAIASLRATTEDSITHDGQKLDVVRGTLLDSGKQAAFYPGDLPDDPARLLHPAREGAEHWLDQDYSVMNFAPSVLSLRPGNGPPHIRLDQVAQFLLGDRL